MLGQGYYEYGVMLMATQVVRGGAMHARFELLPGHTEAPCGSRPRGGHHAPRRIEVSPGYAATLYEDDQPVRTFPSATPRGRRRPRRYEIKTKLPSAYGSQWDLDMPYWLGLYDTAAPRTAFTPCRPSSGVPCGGRYTARAPLAASCQYGGCRVPVQLGGSVHRGLYPP